MCQTLCEALCYRNSITACAVDATIIILQMRKLSPLCGEPSTSLIKSHVSEEGFRTFSKIRRHCSWVGGPWWGNVEVLGLA